MSLADKSCQREGELTKPPFMTSAQHRIEAAEGKRNSQEFIHSERELRDALDELSQLEAGMRFACLQLQIRLHHTNLCC